MLWDINPHVCGNNPCMSISNPRLKTNGPIHIINFLYDHYWPLKRYIHNNNNKRERENEQIGRYIYRQTQAYR